MVALDAWYDRKATGPTVVNTPAELDAVLDTVVDWNAPITVQLLIHGDPGHAILDVGLDARTGRGVLCYAGSDAPDACISKGSDTAEQPPLYFTGSDTEFPVNSEIPLGEARRAAHEYMSTGGRRPTGVEWQPSWN
ncbi:Imm1 family immunity protein [Saccharothrix yanglingensis]|uniref:Imm1 family immunity protein n=1 Tax=Saccharothrix yanglingensis TaxID=659496 RepID=UPI0027D28F3C|nr:Imm1 family immunity protein [Saccharothrix yanglingensis]